MADLGGSMVLWSCFVNVCYHYKGTSGYFVVEARLSTPRGHSAEACRWQLPSETRPSHPALKLVLLRSEGIVAGGANGRIVRERLLLDLLWVREEFRNNGHGKELLSAIEEFARAKGCQDVILETLNARSVRFYLNSGYKCIAKIEGYIPGFDKSVFLKVLA